MDVRSWLFAGDRLPRGSNRALLQLATIDQDRLTIKVKGHSVCP